jgi:hypothetical protein
MFASQGVYHQALFGFPARKGLRYVVESQSFHINVYDMQALRLMEELYRASRSSTQVTWMIAYKDRIGTLSILVSRSFLCLIIARTQVFEVLRFSLWLLGRKRGTLGLRLLSNLTGSPDVRIRKEAVKALRRMERWEQLSSIQETDPNARIRSYATSPPVANFQQRLNDYKRNVQVVPASKQEMELFVHPSLTLVNRTPPKSWQWIRELLCRIRDRIRVKSEE